MEIHFEIENKCILKCRHCSSCASFEGSGFQYSIKQMADFLSAVPEEKTLFFTGGEPLLNKDFETILASVVKNSDHISAGIFTSGIIHTNGEIHAVSDEQARKLAALGLKICYFSVYSHDADMHDWMTRTPGSFRITKESAAALKNAGIEIRFNTVVTKRNQDTVDKIIQSAKSWNAAEVRLLKLIRHGRADSCWEEIGIHDEEYRKTLKQLVNQKHPIRLTASSAIDIMACRPMKNAAACQAGSQLLYITYNGDIYPCASVKNNPLFCIGNIKKKSSFSSYLAEKRYSSGNPLCTM